MKRPYKTTIPLFLSMQPSCNGWSCILSFKISVISGGSLFYWFVILARFSPQFLKVIISMANQVSYFLMIRKNISNTFYSLKINIMFPLSLPIALCLLLSCIEYLVNISIKDSLQMLMWFFLLLLFFMPYNN